MEKIDPERLYQQLKDLAANLPNLRSVDESGQLQSETQIWLGRLFALVEASGDIIDDVRLRTESAQLRNIVGDRDFKAETQILGVLYRALAKAELAAPVSSQGAFIAVGGHFDAFSALSKIFRSAGNQILIVDPYLDQTILTDFIPLANEDVKICLLTDEASMKSSFEPAVRKWKLQHGSSRPLEAKKSPARSLHDRLIILDKSEAWIVTQSFKDFAARTPGTIQKTGVELAQLKIAAYDAIWLSAVNV
jgi:hypothetical protein